MDKEKRDILATFEECLPKLTAEDRAYMLGLSEGMSMNLKAAAAQAPAEEQAETVKAS